MLGLDWLRAHKPSAKCFDCACRDKLSMSDCAPLAGKPCSTSQYGSAAMVGRTPTEVCQDDGVEFAGAGMQGFTGTLTLTPFVVSRTCIVEA